MNRAGYRRAAALALLSQLLATTSACTADDGSDDEIRRRAETIAEKVEAHAERTEPAEGVSDLVKDSTRVTVVDGQPVIRQKGEASFYGAGFHGSRTAAGDAFDQHGRSAAHPTLPFGTEAEVTNLDSGQSVTVRINDRGPYAKGRDIDLSKDAAEAIGLDSEGEVPVKIDARISGEE